MAIVQMKHLRLIAVSEEQDALLDELQRVGCVEISTPEITEDAPDWARLLRRKSSSLDEVSAQLASLRTALDALNKYAPVKEGMLTPRPVVTVDELFNRQTADRALKTAGEINCRLTEIIAAVSDEKRGVAGNVRSVLY